MHIIKIEPFENGAHGNMTYDGVEYDQALIPDGWAVIPDEVQIPDTYPFVDITVENGVVTSMTAGTVPDPEPVPEKPTQLDMIEAQVTYTAMMTDTLLGG